MLTLKIACDQQTRIKTITGRQISIVIRLGRDNSPELCLQVDEEGHYTLDLLTQQVPESLIGGNFRADLSSQEVLELELERESECSMRDDGRGIPGVHY